MENLHPQLLDNFDPQKVLTLRLEESKKQAREFLRRIAEAQIREASMREELERERAAWRREKEKLNAITAALHQQFSQLQQQQAAADSKNLKSTFRKTAKKRS